MRMRLRCSQHGRSGQVARALLLMATAMCAGCGTYLGRVVLREEDPDFMVLPATKSDILLMAGAGGLLSEGGTAAAIAGMPVGLIDLPVSLTTDTLLLPLDLVRYQRYKKKRQGVRAELAATDAIRERPSIVFDEGWHLVPEGVHWAAIQRALFDPRVPFTTDQLRRLASEAPTCRKNVFWHPACSPGFIAESFADAYRQAKDGDAHMLRGMAINRSTPTPLLVQLADSTELPPDVVERARKQLRQRESAATGPPESKHNGQ